MNETLSADWLTETQSRPAEAPQGGTVLNDLMAGLQAQPPAATST